MIITYGAKAFERCANMRDIKTVLDVGAGNGEHTKAFRAVGKEVYSIDHQAAPHISQQCLYPCTMPGQYDLVWCCHTLEHAANVGTFVKALAYDVKQGGYLCITVPPAKHEIVGGHVNLFNMGLLIYRLVLAGIDCSKAVGLQYGYNISVMVQCHTSLELHLALKLLKHDNGDIQALAQWLPDCMGHNVSGDMHNLNWDTTAEVLDDID